MGKAPTPSVRSGKGASRHKSKTEAGDKPFACSHCAARFTYRSGLSKHDRVSHRKGALVQPKVRGLTAEQKIEIRQAQWRQDQRTHRKPKVREAGPCLLSILYDQVAQGTSPLPKIMLTDSFGGVPRAQGMPSLVNQFDDEVAVRGGERFSCSATGERVTVEEVLKVSTLIIGEWKDSQEPTEC